MKIPKSKRKSNPRGAWPSDDTEAALLVDDGYSDMGAGSDDDSDDGF